MLDALLSCIGLVRPSSSADLKQNKQNKTMLDALREAGAETEHQAREPGGPQSKQYHIRLPPVRSTEKGCRF
jgi:hypothetical protein